MILLCRFNSIVALATLFAMSWSMTCAFVSTAAPFLVPRYRPPLRVSSETSAETNQMNTFVEYISVSVFPHRPLGCTVEETLGQGNHVFISKVVEGGAADQAGLQVGDVIVGVTGIFGALEDVSEQGIDKVKGLVSACSTSEPLQLRVARGTTVYEEHEVALVNLCTNGSFDNEVDDCVVDFLASGYEISVEEVEVVVDGAQDDSDSILNEMYNMWADELPVQQQQQAESPKNEEVASKPKVKPWSSRSSPSGTFVRDPKTGKMRNIDA